MPADLIFEHSVPVWGIAAGLALALLITVLTLFWYLPRRWLNLFLVLVRLLFLALLGWCLLLPMIRRVLTDVIKPRFIVALDTSASMTLSPAAQPASNRWLVAQQVLREPWTKRFLAETHFELAPFDADTGAAVPLSQAAGLKPAGPATHLRDGLWKLLNRYKGQSLVGLLLLSDGLDTREVRDDWARESWPCPLYTVRVEPPDIWETEPDLRVESIDTPRRVVVGWDTKLSAVISGQGIKGLPFNVQLFKNGNPLEEQPSQLPDEGGRREVAFRLAHPEIGTYTYTVAVPPVAGETHTNDNLFAITVQVVDSRNRVLFVDGVPRWESKYLIRALKANKNITPLSFVRGPKDQFLTYGERAGMTLDMTEDQLRLYKIIIVGDLDADVLGTQRAAALLKFAETGGSLVLLGGPAAWGKNGFAATDLNKLLPFQRPGFAPAAEGVHPVELTDDGRSHTVFTSGSNTWVSLPPVLSIFGGARLGPAASTLLEALTPQGAQPLVVAQKYGQGKVLAILTDSLWRWQLNPGTDRAFLRFWTQVVEWLSPAEKELEKFELDLFADVERLFMGEPIALKARVSSAEAAIPGGLNVACEILAPGERKLTLAMAGQSVITGAGKSFPGYGVDFSPQTSGLYRAVASVEIEGKRVESSPYSFFVQGFTPETNPRPANAALLHMLAENSNGRFCEPGEIGAALDALPIKTREEQRLEFESLWHKLAILACLLGFLTLEWIVRKAKNLA
jgi:uncharacterized membrane protein